MEIVGGYHAVWNKLKVTLKSQYYEEMIRTYNRKEMQSGYIKSLGKKIMPG